MELEEVLVAVWRQVLVEGRKSVALADDVYPVGHTRRQKLRTVEFRVAGLRLTGIEQNPATGSSWAARARRGAKIMQFSHQGRYIGNVCDAHLTRYAAWRSLGC
ncbi:MAG: hypothetical protein ACE5H2_07630 [Terriglobia bacterium]